jgi:hypothetical protein
MKIGDLLIKLGEGKALSQTELQELRLWGNQTQLNNSFVSGIQNGTGEINSSSVTTKILSTGKDIVSGYAVRLKRTTSFNLPNGSTNIEWNEEEYDDGDFYDANISTTNIIVPRTGIYNVTFGAYISAVAANHHYVSTFRDGASYYPSIGSYLGAGQNYILSASDERTYVKGEIVYLRASQMSGSTSSLITAYFTMRLIREV